MLTVPRPVPPKIAGLRLAPVVTRARPDDAAAIAALLERMAPETLPVSTTEIRRHIHRYRVIREAGRVSAVAALKPLGDDRFELRSVAVDPDRGGRGLGTRLVATLEREAMRRGRTLQCVTLNPGFFERMGFERIPLERLPPKPERDEHPTDRPRVAMEWRPTSDDIPGDDHDLHRTDALQRILRDVS